MSSNLLRYATHFFVLFVLLTSITSSEASSKASVTDVFGFDRKVTSDGGGMRSSVVYAEKVEDGMDSGVMTDTKTGTDSGAAKNDTKSMKQADMQSGMQSGDSGRIGKKRMKRSRDMPGRVGKRKRAKASHMVSGASSEDVEHPKIKYAHANLINNDGAALGYISFMEGARGVIVRLEMTNLPRGWHGVHIHTTGDCSKVADFSSADGHFLGEMDSKHGYLNLVSHAGDLPNIWSASRKSVVKAEFFTDSVTLGLNDSKPNLFKKGGTAVIIHDAEDDHISQPSGTCGKRLACAVIKPGKNLMLQRYDAGRSKGDMR